MKKSLALLASASLIAASSATTAYAAGSIDGSGKSATTEITGNNPVSCKITSVTDATNQLVPDVIPGIKLTTMGTGAEVRVQCNALGSTLTIGTPTTTVDTAAPLSGTTTTVGFKNGGNGIYSSLAVFNPTTPVLVTPASTTATKASGDKAYIAAQVDAPAGQLLQSGDYVVSIPVTLAP